MSYTVAIAFQTVNQLWAVSTPVMPEDVVLLDPPLTFDVLVANGFIVQPSSPAPPPPSTPVDDGVS